MPAADPLPTLLSRALVGFTIELDNEFEHRVPHRTSAGRKAGAEARGPWLVSRVMWTNLLRFVPPEGIPLRELTSQSRLSGLRRWGYISVEDGGERRVRLSPAAERAGRVWADLPAEIERRWLDRFGAAPIADLRAALTGVAERLDDGLPDALPVVTGDLSTRLDSPPGRPAAQAAGLDLSALLARTLLAFTLDFERESTLSLPVHADLLRVLDGDGVRLRDLPGRTGVSKEAVSWALGVLTRDGRATLEPDPDAARGRVARLTGRGERSRDAHGTLLAAVEAGWRTRFGPAALDRLRAALGALTEPGPDGRPLLAAGLAPYPDGWRGQPPYLTATRAMLADPAAALPRHPMVLHRGGWPDGS